MINNKTFIMKTNVIQTKSFQFALTCADLSKKLMGLNEYIMPGNYLNLRPVLGQMFKKPWLRKAGKILSAK
jgi:hypothetical protein